MGEEEGGRERESQKENPNSSLSHGLAGKVGTLLLAELLPWDPEGENQPPQAVL